MSTRKMRRWTRGDYDRDRSRYNRRALLPSRDRRRSIDPAEAPPAEPDHEPYELGVNSGVDCPCGRPAVKHLALCETCLPVDAWP